MIYYICHYSSHEIEAQQRACSPATRNKATYIISKLSEISKVEVISPSITRAHKVVKGSKVKLHNGADLKTFFSFNSSCPIIRFVGRILTKSQFVVYLLKHIKPNDTVIVYHSLTLIRILRFVKRMLGFELIIEAEEIYSDVTNDSRCREREMRFFDIADKYLMITQILNDRINTDHKPVAISHGAYSSIEKFEKLWNDSKIHVVYAGTFNVTKGGVYAAIEMAKYLKADRYHVHILGFGNKEEVKGVREAIGRVACTTCAEVTFHGQLSGDAYLQFLQSCDIGLSTQDPSGAFNATSFPSKILSYMSNGLRVVSIRIPAVESSDVGKYLYYYDRQNPEEIAKTIMDIDLSDDYNGREIVQELDIQFDKELKAMLK